MTRESINRILRSLMQQGIALPFIAAVFALLQELGVPLTDTLASKIILVITTLATLLAVVVGTNALEDATGKSVLKAPETDAPVPAPPAEGAGSTPTH